MFGNQPSKVIYICKRALTTGLEAIGVPSNQEPTEAQIAMAKLMVEECNEGRDVSGLAGSPRRGPCPEGCGLKMLANMSRERES